MISALLARTNTLMACPARRFLISARISGLLMMNIYVIGDVSRICFSELSSWFDALLRIRPSVKSYKSTQ